MKKILLGAFAFVALNTNAQVVNGDVESWIDMDPDGWGTLNFAAGFGGDQTTFQETMSIGEGSSSALLQTGQCDLCAQVFGTNIIPGIMQQKVAIDYRPDSVFFMFKTGSALGGEYLLGFDFSIDTTIMGQVQIVGNQIIPTWSMQGFEIAYSPDETNAPDSVAVTFSSGSGLFGGAADVLGDSIFVDAISLSEMNTSSIAVLKEASYKVYPTIATETVFIEKNIDDMVVVNVYDELGRVMASELFKSNKLALNVQDYANGLYVYQLTDVRGNKLSGGKFIKE